MKPASRSLVVCALCGLLLYAFHHVFNVFVVTAAPVLFALGRASPRLAALGWLALFTSPVAFVAPVHRIGHAVLDRFDSSGKVRDASPGMTSLWAGLFAWFAMAFASLASALLLVAIFPPPIDQGMFAVLLGVIEDARLAVGAHAALWVGIASFLYYVEGVALRGAKPASSA